MKNLEYGKPAKAGTIRPFNFMEWARIISPSKGPSLLAMLSAYFDLSGSHDGKAGITSVAGYVALDEEWAKVEKEWNDALEYWGIGDKFHLSALKRNPAVGHSKYDLCVGYFSNIIKSAKLHPIGAALYDRDWRQPNWGVITDVRLGSSYEQCLDLALRALGSFTETHVKYKGLSVAVVSDPDETEDVINQVFRARQKDFPQFVSLTTAFSRDIVPLQCADLGVGLLRQSWMDIFDNNMDSELPFGSMPAGGIGLTKFWSLRGGHVIGRAVKLTQARHAAKQRKKNKGD